MSFKKTNKIIEELEARLFIVEGEVTDLLTRETMQNLNASTYRIDLAQQADKEKYGNPAK